MKELISIIIPVYNHAHTLGRCLSSIQKQTYRPLEIIVVNDGSTDNFSEVMNGLAKCHSRDRFARTNSGGNPEKINVKIINQDNRGAPAARNAGFAESVGNFVIFWDADTIAKPQMLEKMKQSLDARSHASYAYSQFCFGWKKMKSHEFDAELLRKINYIDTTSLIRRNEFCLFDESLKRFQDWDLWLTMLEKNKTGIFVPEVLYAKIVGWKKGISRWLPSFMYKLPWRPLSVRNYHQALEIILKKRKQTNH